MARMLKIILIIATVTCSPYLALKFFDYLVGRLHGYQSGRAHRLIASTRPSFRA